MNRIEIDWSERIVQQRQNSGRDRRREPGRGFASIAHIPALQALPEFETSAVCTTRQESAEAAARYIVKQVRPARPIAADHKGADLSALNLRRFRRKQKRVRPLDRLKSEIFTYLVVPRPADRGMGGASNRRRTRWVS